RAPIPSILCIVVISDDLDFLDGVLIRGDHRRTAPGDASCSYPVNLVVVFTGPGPICGDLSTVLNLEDTVGATGSPNRRARQIETSILAVALGAIAERPGC